MTSSPAPRPNFPRRCLQVSLLAVAFALASCATVPELGGLMDRGGTSGRRIEVSLKNQEAVLFHRGKVVAIAPISSGREGKGTPSGSYRVIQKSPNHRSSLYGNYVRHGKIVKSNVDVRKTAAPAGSHFEGAPMPYFIRFTGAYGLHAGDLPGYPASSGCVRLPQRHAKRFFDAVKVGTPVVVRG